MSVSKHSEAQIIGALKQLEAGRKAEDVAQEVRFANHRAWMFFCMFLALEVFSAFVFGYSCEAPDIGSAWLRFSAYYGAGLLLSMVLTGVVVGNGLRWAGSFKVRFGTVSTPRSAI